MSNTPTDAEIDEVTLDVLGYAALDKETNDTARLAHRRQGLPAAPHRLRPMPSGRRHARAFVGLGLDLALQGVGLGRCSASAVSRRFGTALAGAGHSLQKASRRMLNARFTSMLKPSCNLDSSPMARSIAGYSTAAACELGPGSMAGSGAIATGCGATGASSSSTVLMPLAMAAAFSGACAIWLAAPCTSSRSSSSRWVG